MIDQLAAKRISSLEKKLGMVIRTNVKIQLQTDETLAKLNKAVEKLRKALPHVNFED